MVGDNVRKFHTHLACIFYLLPQSWEDFNIQYTYVICRCFALFQNVSVYVSISHKFWLKILLTQVETARMCRVIIANIYIKHEPLLRCELIVLFDSPRAHTESNFSAVYGLQKQINTHILYINYFQVFNCNIF